MFLYCHLFQNFPQFIVIHTVKGFGIVNKAEIDVFLELSCFFDDPVDGGNLISDSSAFSKTSLNIRKFTIHILLVEMHKCCSHIGKLAVSSKVKHTLTLQLSNFPRRFLSKRNLHTSPQENLMQTFIAAVVKISPNWKQFKCHQLMNAETNCATFMVWSVKSYKKKKRKKGILPIYRTSWLNLKSI